MEKNHLLWKSLIFTIIVLFVGTSVTSNVSRGLNTSTTRENSVFNKENNLSPFDHPSWQWAVGTEGTFYNNGYSISMGASGNIYVTGGFSEKASFGSATLTSNGESDVFVTKLNNNGIWQWAVQAGGTSNDKGSDICVDSSSNIYIVGYFQGVASFGSTTLTSSGYQDVFVAKLNTNGDWLWVVHAGGSSQDKGFGIDVDSSGNTYVTGFFAGIASFGSTTLTSSGYYDVFVAMLNSNGIWQWAVSGGGTGSDYSRNICVGSSGNTYVTGDFQEIASFGSTTLTSSGYQDVFVAEVNKNGIWQWAVSAGGAYCDIGWDSRVDSSDNIYVTGEFIDIASFGSTTLTSSGYQDVFVAEVNKNGIWQWAVSGGGTGADSGYSICVDASGNPYITGIFIRTVSFGSTTLTSNMSSYDVFVAKLDSNTEWLWAISAGGIGQDTGYSISADSSDNTYVAGVFTGIASFGSTTLTSNGDYFDVFVAKLSDSGGGNLPPNIPFITGKVMGKVGKLYEYTFITKDPEGDNVYYIINWSDGTPETYIGPFASNTEAEATHAWSVKGTYVIKAKARDIYGAESDWATLEVSMPKNRAINPFTMFLERLMERFPIMEQILQPIYDKLT